MKSRLALHIAIGLLIGGALIYLTSSLQAGPGSSFAEMLSAQRHTPVLWVVDICAAAFLAGMCWSAMVMSNFQTYSQHQATQHHEQLEDMIERMTDLEQVNDGYCDRVERLEAELARQFRDLADQVSTLEAAADARRQVFEVETRRISEQAYRLFQMQIETNTSRVEAVHEALQDQRSDMRRLRHDIREMQFDLSPMPTHRVARAVTALPPGGSHIPNGATQGVSAIRSKQPEEAGAQSAEAGDLGDQNEKSPSEATA